MGAILFQLDAIPATAAGLSLLAALIILAVVFERFRRQTAMEGGDEEGAQEVVYFERERQEEPRP